MTLTDKHLERCLFSLVIAHVNTAGVEHAFSARLIYFDELGLLFEDSNGEVTSIPRVEFSGIAMLRSERYGGYNCITLH